MIDNRTRTAGVGRDDGRAGGERLDRDHGRAFVRRRQQEGVERDWVIKWDRFESLAVYSILEPEWRAQPKSERAEAIGRGESR